MFSGKALRAEGTSTERSEEETEAKLEKPKPVKQKKQIENRQVYKYNPPGNKSVLGQKQEESDNAANEDDLEKTPKTKKYLKASKQLKSSLQKEEEDSASDEIIQKKARGSFTKNRKEFKNNEKSVIEENESMKELPNDVLENLESVKPRKDRYYKSLDDMLYEQELKRQKYLSSIREKYASLPDPPSRLDNLNLGKEEENVVTKSIAKIKKYSENNTGILGSKGVENSDITNKKVSKLIKNEESSDDKKISKGAKSNSDKDEYSKRYTQENKKYRINKILKEKDDENIEISEAPKKLNKEKGQLLGEKITRESGKPIVSPYIDDKYKEDKKDENPINAPKLYRASPSNKEYLEKDNELGGATKSKETLNSLIAKIRAKYEKNDRDDRKSREKSKSENKKEEKTEDKSVLSSSSKNTFASRSSKSKDHDNVDFEGSSEDRKPYLVSQKIPSKYVIPKQSDQFEIEDGKKLRISTISKGKSSNEKPLLNAVKNLKDSEEENSEKPSKYLKSKYSGVKPSLIREEKEPEKKKTFGSIQISSKKETNKKMNSEGEEDEGAENVDKPKPITTARAKYLQKTAEKEHEISKPESGLGKQNTKIEPTKSRSIEIDPPREVTNEKVYTGGSLEERKKKIESSLKELVEKNNRNKNVKPELPNKDKFKASFEEERKMYEERVKEVLDKMRADGKVKEYPKSEFFDFKSSSPPEPYSPKERILPGKARNLGTPQVTCPVEKNSKTNIEEQTNLKKPSLREQIEQIKAGKLESAQIKSNEPKPLENSKLSSKQEAPAKLSLKELIDQKKLERQNERSKTEKETNLKGESSESKESPLVSSPLNNKEKDVQAIMDQNPQKHCEQCMKYVNRMSHLQREQMLGQKPQTRSIPSASNQNKDTVETEGEVAQENFLNCRCYQNQNNAGSQSGSILGLSNPNVNDEMLGQPFNMQDVSKTFENIKTGIESSVNGANDKISKGFNDLKTTIRNQYEQASHSNVAENLKDSTDQVSKKISDFHITDAVAKEISDISHSVQNTYESVTQKVLDVNLKDVSNAATNVADKVKSEYHHLTDRMVSQPAPSRYVYKTNRQQVIPAGQLQTKYTQAKYVDPNQQFQPQMSGNANAPISLT